MTAITPLFLTRRAASASSNWSCESTRFSWLPAGPLVDWMSESIVVMVRNAWMASVLGSKLEALDSLDSLTPGLLMFCLLELAMGVRERPPEPCINQS